MTWSNDDFLSVRPQGTYFNVLNDKTKIYAAITHWGRVTHLCVSKLTSIASDNGLSPGWRQAIIWNNARILLIGPLGTNFSEILIEIPTFSLKKIRLKMSSEKCQPFCLGLNVISKLSGRNDPLHVYLQIADLANEDTPQLYTLCGRGPRSTLRVLRHGLEVSWEHS